MKNMEKFTNDQPVVEKSEKDLKSRRDFLKRLSWVGGAGVLASLIYNKSKEEVQGVEELSLSEEINGVFTEATPTILKKELIPAHMESHMAGKAGDVKIEVPDQYKVTLLMRDDLAIKGGGLQEEIILLNVEDAEKLEVGKGVRVSYYEVEQDGVKRRDNIKIELYLK